MAHPRTHISALWRWAAAAQRHGHVQWSARKRSEKSQQKYWNFFVSAGSCRCLQGNGAARKRWWGYAWREEEGRRLRAKEATKAYPLWEKKCQPHRARPFGTGLECQYGWRSFRTANASLPLLWGGGSGQAEIFSSRYKKVRSKSTPFRNTRVPQPHTHRQHTVAPPNRARNMSSHPPSFKTLTSTLLPSGVRPSFESSSNIYASSPAWGLVLTYPRMGVARAAAWRVSREAA